METSRSDFYHYKPLHGGQIRLLDIEPSDDLEASISCSLRHCTYDELDDVYVQYSRKKQYETLSYAWGPILPDDAHLTDIISIDGLRMRVTAHLNRALKRFRQLHLHGRTIWVDALCIDQSNLEERSQQVAEMENVFCNSYNTVIWLGEWRLERHPVVFDFARSRLRLLGNLDKDPYESEDLLRELCELVLEMLRNPWFTRRWVVQESALSLRKTFVIGEQAIGHAELLRIVEQLSTRDARREQILIGLHRVPNSIIRQPGADSHPIYHKSLLHRLFEFRAARHSHPLDCVYALLSIASDRALFTVDYTLTPRELFLTLAEVYVQHDHNLPLLFASAVLRRRPHSLLLIKPHDPQWPSWLPDWQSDTPIVMVDNEKCTSYKPQQLMDVLDSGLREPPDSDSPFAFPDTITATIINERFLRLHTFVLRKDELEMPYPATAEALGAEQRVIFLRGSMSAILTPSDIPNPDNGGIGDVFELTWLQRYGERFEAPHLWFYKTMQTIYIV